MDKKLTIICLTSGIATTVITSGLFFIGLFYISVLGTLLLPGLLFSIVLTKHFKNITSKNKLFFILTSVVIYFVSALTTFYLNGATQGITLILLSFISIILLTVSFDSFVKKLKNMKKSIVISFLGGLLSGLIIFTLSYFIKTSDDIKMQGENGAVMIMLVQLLIFPLWQTAFGLSIK